VRAAFELLAAHSDNHTKDDYGYDFPELGINIYNHDLESEEEPVECFGVATNLYRSAPSERNDTP
jgi:hypothetical protein